MSILTTILGQLPEWYGRGICHETDPESFFPEKGGSTREAKAICTGCPVRAECLDYALDNDERFGIWGGFSERERRKFKSGVLPIPVFAVVPEPVIPTRTPRRVTPTPIAIVPPEPVMPTPQPEPAQPSYVDQIIAVMAATEGHAHPDVRAARKVVANALVSLNKTLRTVDGVTPVPLRQAPPAGFVVAPGPRTRGAGAKALRDRIVAMGVTARDIRAWAKTHGHDVPTAGMVPGWAVDLYAEANPQQAAS
jgi:WhiB family redox-sensing transcriptional regulator